MNNRKQFFLYAFIGSCIFWALFSIIALALNKQSEHLRASVFFGATLLALFIFFRSKKISDPVLVARSVLFGLWFFTPVYFILINIPNLGDQPQQSILNLLAHVSPPGVFFVSLMVGAGPALMIASTFLAYKAVRFNKPRRLTQALTGIVLGIMLLVSIGLFIVSAVSI